MNICLLFAALVIIMLTACQPDLNSNSYDYYGDNSGRVKQGVIQSIQYNVKVHKNTDVGTIAGGIIGGAIGSNVGGSNRAMNVVGTVGSTVVGGIAGKAVERAISDTEGTLYVIKLNHSGRLFSVIEKSTVSLHKGDHVYLINAGGRLHLLLDENYSYVHKKEPNNQ